MTLPIDNKVIIFLYRRSRTFFTANGGLFVFAVFQPAIGQARLWVAVNIRELALEISPDTHGRIGRSPEKPQIFLYLFVVVYSRIKENTLQVTPMAKRNSYRVAILVGRLPRVAGFTLPPPCPCRLARTLCYVVTCLMLRGLVPYDTKLAVWSPRFLPSLPRPAMPSPATQPSSRCPSISSQYAKTWWGMAF